MNFFFKAINSGLNSDQDIPVLVSDPSNGFEFALALKSYMDYRYKKPLYGFIMNRKNKTKDPIGFEMQKNWQIWFKGFELLNISKEPKILVFYDSDLIPQFFTINKLNFNLYKTKYSNVFTVLELK